MKSEINLSYVLTTFNKLPYLKEVMDRLIENCQEDEEIVVIDGASTDGTPEYLQELFLQGKIHQFISEKDFGEAHGFNKGVLMANGSLIKLITDDDVFFYPLIKECKAFMLANPSVHVLNTNGGWAELNYLIDVREFTDIYQVFFSTKWLTERHPFSHCGLGILFRKDAIPLLGLLGVGFYRADAEYTLRITSQKINFVWYTGVCYVRILNGNSNSTVLAQRINNETTKLNAFYGFDIDKIYETINQPSTMPKTSFFNKLRHQKSRIKAMVRLKRNNVNLKETQVPLQIDYQQCYINSLNWLAKINNRNHIFLQ